MTRMTKQIYVIISSMFLCIIIWFSLSVAILYFTKTIQKIDHIYSILDTERVNVEIDTNCN